MLYLTTHPLISFTIKDSDIDMEEADIITDSATDAEDSTKDVNLGIYFNKEVGI